MEFGQIQLHYSARELVAWSATSSQAGCRPSFWRVAGRFELSRHVVIARTWSQTGSQRVCNQLVSWIGQIPLRYPAH